MLFSEFAEITRGKTVRLTRDLPVTDLVTDSRKAPVGEGVVFLAIKGEHHDGHDFLPQLYARGIRQFVVERPVENIGNDTNLLLVDSCINALQRAASRQREKLAGPVIGITGSNGKTIIKEWLYQLLSPEYKIAKNPASYNSQLGVPLSVWQIRKHHSLGIFEAGISTVGEMQKLEKIIRPTIGIFTNIGPAHNEGFRNIGEKVSEKLDLFAGVKCLIYCKDHALIDTAVQQRKLPVFTWGFSPNAEVHIRKEGEAYIGNHNGNDFRLDIPFSDRASVENALHCVALLLYLKYDPDRIRQRISTLRAVAMRLELKEGINHCQIIDDTYNNDLAGLQVSLDFLAHQHQRQRKTAILSDILESGLSDSELMEKVGSMLASAQVRNFVGIGPVMSSSRKFFPPDAIFFRTTGEFLRDFDFSRLRDEVILVKGARVFAFEKIVNRIQRRVHGTVMEIDLGALVENLNYFRARLKPSTKVMAMVKAFAYGSGSNEIANVLQYHKIDYLGVAYADEGVDLRRNNITLPIMVMNPAEESFETLLEHRLEPEIFNFRILHRLTDFLDGRPCDVHLKLDTGMRRLGFDEDETEALISLLLERPNIKVASVFSHLAAADESGHDDFTRKQASVFLKMAETISQRLGYRPIFHILNSPGILRFPQFQFDMVRLGIGLYGVDPTESRPMQDPLPLKPVATLKTTISQIKHINEGESVGYGRKGIAARPLTIATIAIGYADGFSRAFSRGVGKVFLNGKLAPVVGNVCMDMTMIDITGIPAREGDEVVIFGKELPIQQLADSAKTIPYEILTSTSERVKRVFVAESI